MSSSSLSWSSSSSSFSSAPSSPEDCPATHHSKTGDGGGGSSGNASEAAAEDAAREISKVIARLRRLEESEFVVMLGGGAGRVGLKAILITQRLRGTFTVTVVNRNVDAQEKGDSGMLYHPYFLDGNLEVLRKTVLTFSNIPEAKMLDEAVWYTFYLEMRLLMTVGSGFSSIYEVVLPHLVGSSLGDTPEMQEKVDQRASSAPPDYEDVGNETAAQGRWRALEGCVAYILRARGASGEQVGEVLLETDVAVARRLGEEVRMCSPESKQVAGVVMQEFCSGFRRRMRGGYRRLLRGSQVDRSNALVSELQASAERLIAKMESTAQPCLQLTEGAMTACAPWVLSGMCQRAEAEAWAGPVMETSTGSFVDLRLMLPDEAAQSADHGATEIIELIHACATKCLHLECRGAVIGFRRTMHRLAAIVEHCFLERLHTLPEPPGDPVVLQHMPGHGLAKGQKVEILKYEGATVHVRWESGDAHVPAAAVGDDPSACVYRRLWAGSQTLQQRMLTDLHAIAKHYAMAVIVEERKGISVGARTLTTFTVIMCILDAALRARSSKPMFFAEVLRGNVLEDERTQSCVPVGLACSTISGVDVRQLSANVACCNSRVLVQRAKALRYLQAVEALARPREGPSDAAEDAPTEAGPWLLFDWRPDLDMEQIRSQETVRVPVRVANGKRDDVTLRMWQACVAQYLVVDASPDLPAYLKGDALPEASGAWLSLARLLVQALLPRAHRKLKAATSEPDAPPAAARPGSRKTGAQELHENARRQKLQLHKQAADLMLEYNARKAQEEINHRQYEIQLQHWEAENRTSAETARASEEQRRAQLELGGGLGLSQLSRQRQEQAACRATSGLPEFTVDRWMQPPPAHAQAAPGWH
ncbi:unnamed protein product [Prorocentrum cordatum]|uniref:Uncharacterized protein n=1 Tax=Prorocentrum cordatum TaxID=2364126 RepID=A0ABN9X272_9DINO|nr:unnamed protein product [Polarella glacialis]